MINHIRLIENDTDFVLITLESFNASLELIRDVQFVGIKEKNDSVNSFSKPFQNTGEVVATVDSKK